MGFAARRPPKPPEGDPAEHAREIALRLLGHAPRSASRLRDAMVERGVEADVAQGIIDRYRDVGLLDDPALAAAIVRTRHRERGQARQVIRQELRRKGFEPDDIDTALLEVTDDSEHAAASDFVARRWIALRDVAPDVRARRIVGALGRRGFSPGIAFSLVRSHQHADIWDNQTRGADRTGEE